MNLRTFTLLAALLLTAGCATAPKPVPQKPKLDPKVEAVVTYAKTFPLEVERKKDSRGLKNVYTQQIISGDNIIVICYQDRSTNGNDKPNGIIGPEDDVWIDLGDRIVDQKYNSIERFFDTGLDGLRSHTSDHHRRKGTGYVSGFFGDPEHKERYEALLDMVMTEFKKK